MPPAPIGPVVDLLGFLTGAALYVMLVAMVWRERRAERQPLLSRRSRLPLMTGVCGVAWNLGALVSFAMRDAGGEPATVIVALSFSALGFLPAVVVHSLFEGREAVAGRAFTRAAITAAYGLSATAAALHLAAAMGGLPVPSRSALWLLTGGFTAIAAVLLLITRDQPIGRRGVWVTALSLFAVSALHFVHHSGNESWWVELVGHHASLLLALAILHQDYRFAFADLFLKNAIALLLLMCVSATLFSGALAAVVHWPGAAGGLDPRALVVCVLLWAATAMLFPVLRTLAGRLVDRVVLRRSDYEALLTGLALDLDALDREGDVVARLITSLQVAAGAADARSMEDPCPAADQRLVIVGAELRLHVTEPAAFMLRVATVDAPYRAIAAGRLGSGRRLLSDDVRFLERVSRLSARRIDAIRVTQERFERDLREQRMRRFATEAELRALRAQLNPHFLFNALTTIGHLIQVAPPRALATLLRLTSVLRSVLRRSAREFSTLGQEIELVTSYLDIERERFDERLRVSIDVPPLAGDVVIPSLLLQPIVENAVKHGIGSIAAGGEIRVVAALRQGRLRILVEDSGGGFDPASAHVSSGVGLANVIQRLRAHYGATATCTVESAIDRGTRVEFDLPAVRAADPAIRPLHRRAG